MQGRGLKLIYRQIFDAEIKVAPYAGAWIETINQKTPHGLQRPALPLLCLGHELIGDGRYQRG